MHPNPFDYAEDEALLEKPEMFHGRMQKATVVFGMICWWCYRARLLLHPLVTHFGRNLIICRWRIDVFIKPKSFGDPTAISGNRGR